MSLHNFDTITQLRYYNSGLKVTVFAMISLMLIFATFAGSFNEVQALPKDNNRLGGVEDPRGASTPMPQVIPANPNPQSYPFCPTDNKLYYVPPDCGPDLYPGSHFPGGPLSPECQGAADNPACGQCPIYGCKPGMEDGGYNTKPSSEFPVLINPTAPRENPSTSTPAPDDKAYTALCGAPGPQGTIQCETKACPDGQIVSIREDCSKPTMPITSNPTNPTNPGPTTSPIDPVNSINQPKSIPITPILPTPSCSPFSLLCNGNMPNQSPEKKQTQLEQITETIKKNDPLKLSKLFNQMGGSNSKSIKSSFENLFTMLPVSIQSQNPIAIYSPQTLQPFIK